MDDLIKIAAELQSLAQSGLFYTKDVYDKERFERIRELSAKLMSIKTNEPIEKINNLFCQDYGYQTPKIDTRAAIFKGNKVLLVQEKNGNWALPGGWCEFNMSPVDNVKKEALEEAGRQVEVKSVIAVQNRDNHNIPMYAYGIVKIFYLCEELGGEFKENTETLQAKYFSMDELPKKMSPEKCNEEQVKLCFEAYNSGSWVTQFD